MAVKLDQNGFNGRKTTKQKSNKQIIIKEVCRIIRK